MMKKYLLAILVLLTCSPLLRALTPDGTFLFARRDTCDLYLDIYRPAEGAATTLDGKEKPALLFVFGGGFIIGARNESWYFPWFQALLDEGYPIVAVDYRLGLKGVRMRFDPFHLIESAKLAKRAVDMGVEDVFASVRYLCDNAEELGIDPDNIVICGSSAGAMISLSSELEACNRTSRAAILPEGFHKMGFGRRGMFGSSYLVEKVLKPAGYTYQIYRYVGHSHDMAANMLANWPEEKRFLEVAVMGRNKLVIDSTVEDPTMPVLGFASVTLDDIY